MKKQIIIIKSSQIALVYVQGKIMNLLMAHEIYQLYEIYAGKIDTILPGLNAAFVNLYKTEKNGFLQAEDLKHLKIEKYKNSLKNNDKKHVIVQIRKEPTGTKGPRISTDIVLSGRYVNLTPFSGISNLDKKINNEKERNYIRGLTHLLKPNWMSLELGYSTIITTTKFLASELKLLKQRWKRILKRSEQVKSPGAISRKKDLITKTLEQKYNLGTTYIALDSEENATNVHKIVLGIKRKKKLRIEYSRFGTTLIREYSIDVILSRFILPKVNINNGGYIIIEKTEALTTIDVNSGSFINSRNSRATSFWTNYIAVLEIVNQIKIRNIGGIIIIDFIDSTNQEDQIQILSHLSYKLKYELIPTNIIQMSELGLVEITRARQGQSIYDALSKQCMNCDGLGYTPKFNPGEVKENFELITQLLPMFSNE